MTELLKFPPYVIALLLSLLVGFLVVSLVVNSKFREDMLSNENENVAKLFGMTISGGRFFAILAIFLGLIGGIFYLYPLESKIDRSGNPATWIPFDTESLTPTSVMFATRNDTIRKSSDLKSFKGDLKIDRRGTKFTVSNESGEFSLGNIPEDDFKALGFFDSLEWASDDQIVKFDMKLKPFSAKIANGTSDNYDTLPLEIELYLSHGNIFYRIRNKNTKQILGKGFSLNDDKNRKPFLFNSKTTSDQKSYFIRNYDSQITKDSSKNSYAHFEIIVFNRE